MQKKFITIIFACLIFLSACSSKKEIDPVSDAQWKAFSYLPGDTQFLMFMNLKELRKTEFWETYFKSSFEPEAHQPPAEINGNSNLTDESDLFNSSNSWLSGLEKETGVGFEQGISDIFFSSNGGNQKTAVICFDKNLDGIKSYFRKNFEPINIKEKIVYRFKNEQPLFYFIDDSTLLASKSEKNFRLLISKTNYSLKDNKNLIEAIKGIENKNHFWIASEKGSYTEALLQKIMDTYKNIPAKRILKSIDNVTLSAEFTKGVEIESTLGCSNLKNAYLLSTAIKGALAMDLLSGSDYLLGKALEKMEVERTNKKINLKINLEDEDIKHLKDIVKKNNIDKKL